MKLLRAAACLFGLLSCYASFADEKPSPEEAKKRKDWSDAIIRKPTPKKGCFKVEYPKTEWQEVPCGPKRNIPMMPRHGPIPFTVGGGNDVQAHAPSGTITQAIGRFENVNVTSEAGQVGGAGAQIANAYTLQMNTNFMTSNSVCSSSPNSGCQGWEQFIYENDGGTGNGSAYIQYWIIAYNKACPSGWNTSPVGTSTYCWRNNTGGVATVPNQAITNMANWVFSGAVTATSDTVTMTVNGTGYAQTGDNTIGAAAGWTTAEFNLVGDGGSGQANFNSGASADVRTEIIYGSNGAPTCAAGGTTAETNNLSFGPTTPTASAPGPAVLFEESTAGGIASSCAAASTIGDTHLRTFNGLFYDFQASGDFTLAEVDPGFAVQTRQVSGAPTWPDATVNKAVAARFGNTRVAICLDGGVHVDGKLTTIEDGKTLEAPGGVGIARVGNVYRLTSDGGDSVSITVNAGWMDVAVGLGRWPSAVHGLIANAGGDVNKVESRDHVVLTNPFAFDQLYGHFAESWRLSAADSLLTVCNSERVIERGVPKRPFYARDLEAGVREKAQGVCTAAGVKAGPLLDACTLDVAVIGQDAAAKVFVTQLPPKAVGTITGGGGTGGGGGGFLEAWWWLVLLLLVLVLVMWFVVRKNP